MSLRIGLVLLFFIIGGNLEGQSFVRDSLLNSFEQAESDSLRAYWSSRLAWYYLNYDLDSAEVYIRRARPYYKITENEAGNIVLSHYQGLVHRLKGEFPQALDTFQRVLQYHKLKGDSVRMTGPLFNLGVVYSLIGDYEKSLHYYYQELAINQAMGNTNSIANSLNSIGNIHKNRGNLEQALETYTKALKGLKSVGDPGLLANIYGNLATVYFMVDRLDSAQVQAEKSLNIDQDLGREWGVAHSLFVLGEIARAKQRNELASEYFLKAIAIRQRLGQPIELLESYQAYADLLLDQNRLDDAIPLIRESITLADSVSFLKGQENGYYQIANAYAKKGEFSLAFQNLKKFGVLKDSIVNLEKEKTLQELDVRYEVNERERAMAQLEAENQWQQEVMLRERSARIAFLISTLLFAVVLVGAIVWYRDKSRRDRQYQEQRLALQDATIKQLAEQEKVNTLNAMISGQEEERKRIASDLHDSLGSLLSSIKLHVRAVFSDTTEKPGELSSMLDYASEEVRRIAHHMMPDVLQFGLGAAINDLTTHFNQQEGVEVTHQLIGQEPIDFPDSYKIMLYRLTQEGLQNALRHGRSKHVFVQLSWMPENILLTIEDDGQGFDQTAISNGLGLRSMRSRVDFMKGRMHIDSQRGEGTSIEVMVPMDHD